MRQRSAGLIAAHTLALGLYGGTKWWDQGFSGRFRSENEGWFGKNTYAGVADKLGHFYINYASTRLFARAFEWAGNSSGDALALAAWTTAGTYAAVEVIDGFSKEWRFSKEDAAINLLGVGAALLLEKKPELDRVLDLRVHYWPSAGRRFDPFGDYSGQTYLIVAKASGMPSLHDHPWLRYVEFAAGYNARDFSDTPAGAADSAHFVYEDSCNHTKEAIDYMVEVMRQAAIAHAVPPGHVVVPVEPTSAMVRAGWDVEELVTPCRTWAAMIAAAPDHIRDATKMIEAAPAQGEKP